MRKKTKGLLAGAAAVLFAGSYALFPIRLESWIDGEEDIYLAVSSVRITDGEPEIYLENGLLPSGSEESEKVAELLAETSCRIRWDTLLSGRSLPENEGDSYLIQSGDTKIQMSEEGSLLINGHRYTRLSARNTRGLLTLIREYVK